MEIARFIAQRYYRAKKKRNVIHLITRISIIGIAISTASLIILLSVFNGIEQMVIDLYSDFDASLTIRSKKAKTFNQYFIDIERIEQLESISQISRAVEEIVILKRDDKWVHAQMVGVDTSFLQMSKMKEHIVDGTPSLYVEGEPQAIFGAYLLDKLGGYVPMNDHVQERIVFNVPLREGRLKPNKNPLNVRKVSVAARMNYNREVNDEIVLIPYDLGRNLLSYGEDISAFYIGVKENVKLSKVKDQLQKIVGPDFEVKTNLEKNELIFQTSRTERLIVYIILLFIFVLASFNLIASITMLFVEKSQDITTLFSMGANRDHIFKIFFYEALIIVGRGIFYGLIIGYSVVFTQIFFGVIQMPNVPGEVFPIQATLMDTFLIVSSTIVLGLCISYFPIRILVRKHSVFS